MQTQLGIIKPISFIERFSSKLNYTSEMTKLGKFIVK